MLNLILQSCDLFLQPIRIFLFLFQLITQTSHLALKSLKFMTIINWLYRVLVDRNWFFYFDWLFDSLSKLSVSFSKAAACLVNFKIFLQNRHFSNLLPVLGLNLIIKAILIGFRNLYPFVYCLKITKLLHILWHVTGIWSCNNVFYSSRFVVALQISSHSWLVTNPSSSDLLKGSQFHWTSPKSYIGVSKAFR